MSGSCGRRISRLASESGAITEVDYSEKQFETAANIEIALLGADVFAPSQVAEGILGYDAAVSGSGNAAAIAKIVGSLIPSGVRLCPNHWHACPNQPKASQLPGQWIAFVLQWKRPERLVNPPLPVWAGQPSPFYRFAYRDQQRDVLERLEDELRGAAAVRYGSPAVPSMRHLEAAQVRRRVLSLTHFVRPGAGAGHDAWTYRTPNGMGYPNESGPGEVGVDFAGLVGESFNEPDAHPTAERLLLDIGARLDGAVPNLGYGAVADEDIGAGQARALYGLLLLSAVAGLAGASVWLANFDRYEHWMDRLDPETD